MGDNRRETEVWLGNGGEGTTSAV